MFSDQRALTGGPSEISLFCDGSYQMLIAVGTWAFGAPALRLEGAGLETGDGVEHFEVLGALAGIETILEVDRTRRAIRVHSDSDPALLFLQHAAKGEPLPTRKTFTRIKPLYDRAVISPQDVELYP